MKNILIIVGTRPEAIKLMPVYMALRKRYNVKLLSTGQHREMLAPIFDFFEIRPDIELDLMITGQSLASLTSLLFSALSKPIENSSANLLIVQGDTTTAMVAAMVGHYNRIAVAHVEAGLRTKDKNSPFPEEINRRVISLVATLHFAPTHKAAENLMGSKHVHVVGNTVIDSLHYALKAIQNRKDYGSRFSRILDPGKTLILITAHRRESFGEGLENICRAIEILSVKYPQAQFVIPVHLNPHVKEKVNQILGTVEAVKLIDPLPYDDMVYLMSKSFMILTDSGGIQEEAPALGVPVIVMRDVTERPEGIESGCTVLAGRTTRGIILAFERIFSNPALYEAMKNAVNPYGDGNASNRIADVIHDFL